MNNFGSAASQTKSYPCRSTPIQVFTHQNTILVLHFDGQITEIAQQIRTIKLPDKILCADLNTESGILAIGTSGGLVVFNLQKTEVTKVTNYRLAVPHVQFSGSMLFASFLDMKGEQPQFKTVNNQDYFVYTVVMLDDTFKVVAEAPDQLCSGQFDFQEGFLHIPQLTSQIRIYSIIKSQFKLSQTVKTPISSPIVRFFALELIVFESGVIHFLKTEKLADFEMRVNAVSRTNGGFLFGLQNGTIRFVNQDLQFSQVYNGKGQEVCCMAGEAVNAKFVIGLGSLQNIEGNGEIVESTLREIAGCLQVPV
ncbi:Conserved_hypothetical protein [Hexamita inflata]|uniref:Uncharacterized protein n=1 Tax=Hexamita inflata TaxID=28002 RepID=A0AA86P2V1_9EUKA|nr:Conserved hypothetical protein [Hexamita inflata]